MDPRPTPPIPTATWADLATADASLAERIEARFRANLHHVLGTLRRDGSPRLSGTEVQFEGGAVLLGMMAGSRKLEDARRDPRAELHSAPLEDDLAQGDARLAGHLRERDEPPPGHPGAATFELLISSAILLTVGDGALQITTWRPNQDVRTTTRH